MKETYLYKKLGAQKVQCRNCAHYCVIGDGEKGKCAVRENRGGKLYSLVYGRPCALHIDPIEKKPFFHFLPGTQSLSVATVGCNFGCWSCLNWRISQCSKMSANIQGEEIPPEKIVEMALQNSSNKVKSISYTYTEPAVFSEYALDIMKIAKKAGLKNNWVSNGFWSKELFELIVPYLDAANIDLKSIDKMFYIKYCRGKLVPVLELLKRLKKSGVWVEVTTLIIPGLNDSTNIFENIAKFIKQELGAETPWHVSQFSGAISWKLQSLSDTSLETLKKAYRIGREAGLRYVYTGNVPGINSEDTYCSKCNSKMIKRNGYRITRCDKNGKCSKCAENLNIID